MKSLIFFSALSLLFTYCKSQTTNTSLQNQSKIHFNLEEIDENGLIGPPGGKRSVAYEFCIPTDKEMRKEISRIDSSAQFYEHSKGRVACGEKFYLCIGEGATKEILLKLAQLKYINSIEPFYGE